MDITQKQRKSSGCVERSIVFDVFPRHVHLHLPTGRDKYQSITGMITSAIFFVALITIFLIHAVLEVNAADVTGVRLYIRLPIDFGGIAVVLYAICWLFVRLSTKNELENYLVSEMFKSMGRKRQR